MKFWFFTKSVIRSYKNYTSFVSFPKPRTVKLFESNLKTCYNLYSIEKHLFSTKQKDLKCKQEENVDKNKTEENGSRETEKCNYKIYVVYYGVLFLLFSIFSYCLVQLLFMLFYEPEVLKIVKEQVRKDEKLKKEYGDLHFSLLWTGFVKEEDARIIINIKSKSKNKRGRIICNLIKKNEKWKIMTLTFYNIKKNENLETDDLKTLQQDPNKMCPINSNDSKPTDSKITNSNSNSSSNYNNNNNNNHKNFGCPMNYEPIRSKK